MAYPESYAAVKAALQERFEPKSLKTRYQAEFQTRRKKKSEGWADFSEDLKMLTDKAYPELAEEARERLAVNTYLQQLDHPQVAFSVRQKQPETLDEAVAATLEAEACVPPAGQTAQIFTVQEDEKEEAAPIAAVDSTSKLVSLVERLVERVENLEKSQARGVLHQTTAPTLERTSGARYRGGQQYAGRQQKFDGTCWRCQKKGHIARNCPQTCTPHQGN